MSIKTAWIKTCFEYIVLYSWRRQHSMDIWCEREKDILYIDASWLVLFFPLSSYSIACHTSVFIVVIYVCIIKKTVSDWFWNYCCSSGSLLQRLLMDHLYFFQSMSKIYRAVSFEFLIFFHFCYIMLIKVIFGNYVPKMEQTAWSGTRLFGNLEHF